MKKSIFYLTFNGVFNNTNGVGTQTKTLLQGIELNYQKLTDEFGAFELNLIVPIYNHKTWGYDKSHVLYAENIVKQTGGRIFYIPYSIDISDFWTVSNWRAISYSAAATVLQNSAKYSESLVITVDPPYMHTPLLIERSCNDFGVKVKSLITMYSSTYILEQSKVSYDKLGWEYEGLASARQHNNIRIAKICDSFATHLQQKYGADEKSFVNYTSSLLLESEDFALFSDNEVKEILNRYSIPTDKKIVLAFGRADYVKGFDIFLNSLEKIKAKVHIVMIASSHSQKDPIIDEYKRIIKTNNISDITLVTHYTRDLPKALSQWPKTDIAVCPSRGDTFPNVPMEIALWAKNSGPICVTSNADGLDEQITDGYNGYKFDITTPESLTDVLEQTLAISSERKAIIRKNAYEKVIRERDFYKNFRETLAYFWNK